MAAMRYSVITRVRVTGSLWRLSACLVGALMGLAQPSAHAEVDFEYYQNELPPEIQFDGGVVGYRIVNGQAANPGAWPSMVQLFRRDVKGAPICGGAIIDSQWALTAAHCVFEHRAREFFIREGTNTPGAERLIDVSNVIIHERYSPNPPLNDVALLQLATPAQSPRQLLLGGNMRPELLHEHNMATVVGYGLTRPNDNSSLSQKLLQVDLPLVSAQRCRNAYNQSAITEATICAGFDEGGKDSCQGDSGGPIYVQDTRRQVVQAGIVSWGAGCARPGKYGVYTSIGYFESWIKQRVRDASFLTPAPPTPTDATLASYVSGPTDKPGQLGQVSVDIIPGSSVHVGDVVTFRITSSIPGSLLVYNQDVDGRSYQIFPNKYSSGARPGQATTQIAAGQTITVPGPTDSFVLRITPPAGMNRVIAMVIPAGVRIEDIAQRNADMAPIVDLNGLLEALAARELNWRGVAVEPAPKNRAVGVRDYQITQ
jgi:hypothetical protein